jgi:hypothetical protein
MQQALNADARMTARIRAVHLISPPFGVGIRGRSCSVLIYLSSRSRERLLSIQIWIFELALLRFFPSGLDHSGGPSRNIEDGSRPTAQREEGQSTTQTFPI